MVRISNKIGKPPFSNNLAFAHVPLWLPFIMNPSDNSVINIKELSLGFIIKGSHSDNSLIFITDDPSSNKKHDVIEYINIIVKIGAVPNTRI